MNLRRRGYLWEDKKDIWPKDVKVEKVMVKTRQGPRTMGGAQSADEAWLVVDFSVPKTGDKVTIRTMVYPKSVVERGKKDMVSSMRSAVSVFLRNGRSGGGISQMGNELMWSGR